MLRSLQKSVRPALSSSWRAAQPSGSATALGLGFSLPPPAHPAPNRNGSRAFHKAFTAANWRQDPAAPVSKENVDVEVEAAPKSRTVDPAVTKFVGIWNVPKDTTEEEIKAYLVQECGLSEDVNIRMVLSERHRGWNVFLELESIESAQKALEAIAQHPFKGTNLHASSSRGPKAPNGRTNTVVIGNVGRQIHPDELTQYLEKTYTGVKSVRISEIRIPAVFLQFENEEFAEVALENLKGLDNIQMPTGQATHKIFATFANNSHGMSTVEEPFRSPQRRTRDRDEWETSSQVSRASQGSRYTNSRRPQDRPKLWIGNLPEGYDRAQLRELFKAEKGFASMYSPEGGRWAHVEFNSQDAAAAARSNLDGATFGTDTLLNVQFARPRQNQNQNQRY